MDTRSWHYRILSISARHLEPVFFFWIFNFAIHFDHYNHVIANHFQWNLIQAICLNSPPSLNSPSLVWLLNLSTEQEYPIFHFCNLQRRTFGKNLSEWNFILTYGIRRDWGSFVPVYMVYRVLAAKVKDGGTEECSPSKHLP